MMPMVRSRERLLYIENRRKVRSKLLDGLNIIIRGPNARISMIEIDVRRNESAAAIQKLPYFAKLLQLNLANILEDPLRHNYVEPLAAKCDRPFHEIALHEIRRWRVNCYVNPMILYVPSEQSPESRRSATNIE